MNARDQAEAMADDTPEGDMYVALITAYERALVAEAALRGIQHLRTCDSDGFRGICIFCDRSVGDGSDHRPDCPRVTLAYVWEEKA